MMSLIKRLTPINFLEEKKKFFADETYNPQFKYEQKVNQKILLRYGQPNNATADLAQTIIDQAYAHKTETQLRKLRGPQITQQQVEEKIAEFLDIHGLRERFKIVWSNSFVARTTITSQAIKLRLPADFRQLDLLSMLYHEIGTHALRRVNYEHQPWFRNKKEYGFKNYLQTEEGLATLHSLLPLKFQLAYVPALNYVAVKYAQDHSFTQVWKFLTPYIDDPKRRFVFTFRKKRGLIDTSQPGGFTKDLVYFAGMIKVLKYLKKNDFDITKLYFGKVAIEDMDKAVKMNPNFKPLLPSFFVVDKVKYANIIAAISQTNMLGTL
jgi:hypothetical protein